MKQTEHRAASQPISELQTNNRLWWSSNPMTYDWKGTISLEPLTEPWFAEIDDRLLAASRPYLTAARPFDRIMPDSLIGKRVLEIGCGMGLHTAELVRRGGDVTAIDITDYAVDATTARLKGAGLIARVMKADAEDLLFDNAEFDFVWSWGVIHHSAYTTRIVRQIARVLSSEGETRLMVYNREGTIARYLLFRHYILGGGFRNQTPDGVLWQHTDGFMARYYHPEQFADLLSGFFSCVELSILGQEVDAIPLPSRLRALIARCLSDNLKRRIVSKHGGFIFATASHPR